MSQNKFKIARFYFLYLLCQTAMYFDNLWQKDGKTTWIYNRIAHLSWQMFCSTVYCIFLVADTALASVSLAIAIPRVATVPISRIPAVVIGIICLIRVVHGGGLCGLRLFFRLLVAWDVTLRRWRMASWLLGSRCRLLLVVRNDRLWFLVDSTQSLVRCDSHPSVT